MSPGGAQGDCIWDQNNLTGALHDLQFIKFKSGQTHTCFFYKHGVFQSEARICLSFSQLEPQNMLKICLSKNIEKGKFHDLTNALRE